MAPISPSAAPPQNINLDNDTTFPFPSSTIFVLAPSLSPQLLYLPNMAKRPGTDLLSNSPTKPYNLPDRLFPQYLFPPNEAFQQQTWSAFMPPKHDTSLLKTTNQQYANCSLSPQYLHSQNWLERSKSNHLPQFLIDVLTAPSPKHDNSLPFTPNQQSTSHQLMPDSHQQLSPQYLYPPNFNCLWRLLIYSTHLQLHRSNLFLSPQYLFLPNIVF